METTLLFTLNVPLLFSCNKNQRQVIKVDGKWNVKSAEMVGIGTLNPDVIYEFEYGKLKQDGFYEFPVRKLDMDVITSGIFNGKNLINAE